MKQSGIILIIFNLISFSSCFECGVRKIEKLVENVGNSYEGQWPWLVKVSIGKSFCGASIINEFTLLTGENFPINFR